MVPVLSEFHAFPINTDLDAVTNCLSNVEKCADIFVLIVGGRYGSTVDGGKSITNLEYAEAKAKKIPIYVFVQKSILTILSTWERNKCGDFSNITDSTKLFDFVSEIRDTNKSWVFSFETAQDITNALTIQFGYLFKEALEIRSKLLGNNSAVMKLNISSSALRILSQKPKAWEYLFFGQVLSDEISKFNYLRRDVLYSIALGGLEQLYSYDETFIWINQQLDNICMLTSSLDTIFNIILQDVLGAPGVESDVEGLVYAANRIAVAYRRLLEWIIRFRHVKTDIAFSDVLHLISQAPLDICQKAENFPARIHNEITTAFTEFELTGTQQIIDITLVLNVPENYLEHIEQELQALRVRMGIPNDPTP